MTNNDSWWRSIPLPLRIIIWVVAMLVAGQLLVGLLFLLDAGVKAL